jgi:Mrp family chromosome partitioning ATPase
MSIAAAAPSPHPTDTVAESPVGLEALPRVRHQARDAATLMVFSAATSVGVAAFFLLLAVAARQA